MPFAATAGRAGADTGTELVLSASTDVPIVAVGGIGFLLGTVFQSSLAPSSCRWCDGGTAGTSSLNGLDAMMRGALRWNDTATAVDNLAREGIVDDVHLVGNTMIDSLLAHLETARAAAPWSEHGLNEGGYGLVQGQQRVLRVRVVRERALKVGSLDRIITPVSLRAYLIDAVERGMAKTRQR